MIYFFNSPELSNAQRERGHTTSFINFVVGLRLHLKVILFSNFQIFVGIILACYGTVLLYLMDVSLSEVYSLHF